MTDRQTDDCQADSSWQRAYAWNLKMPYSQIGTDRFHSSGVRFMLIEQCKRQNVKAFFKQWGGLRPKSGERTINGRTYSEYPKLKPAVSKKQSIKVDAARNGSTKFKNSEFENCKDFLTPLYILYIFDILPIKFCIICYIVGKAIFLAKRYFLIMLYWSTCFSNLKLSLICETLCSDHM